MWIFLPFWPILLYIAWSDSKVPTRPGTSYTIPSPEFPDLIGKEGLVVTPLRPAGRARIDDSIYDALSQDEIIDLDANIRVVDQDGMNVKVQKI